MSLLEWQWGNFELNGVKSIAWPFTFQGGKTDRPYRGSTACNRCSLHWKKCPISRVFCLEGFFVVGGMQPLFPTSLSRHACSALNKPTYRVWFESSCSCNFYFLSRSSEHFKDFFFLFFKFWSKLELKCGIFCSVPASILANSCSAADQ